MTSIASGTPGSVMAKTRTTRTRSQVIITRRRDSLSARPDRNMPPTNVGTTLAAKATASTAEWVRSYTSRVTPTLAS